MATYLCGVHQPKSASATSAHIGSESARQKQNADCVSISGHVVCLKVWLILGKYRRGTQLFVVT